MEYPDQENESGRFDAEAYADWIDYLYDQEKDRRIEEQMKKEEEAKNVSA